MPVIGKFVMLRRHYTDRQWAWRCRALAWELCVLAYVWLFGWLVGWLRPPVTFWLALAASVQKIPPQSNDTVAVAWFAVPGGVVTVTWILGGLRNGGWSGG